MKQTNTGEKKYVEFLIDYRQNEIGDKKNTLA